MSPSASRWMKISPDIQRRFNFLLHRLPARLSLPEQVYLSAHTVLCVSLILCVLGGGGWVGGWQQQRWSCVSAGTAADGLSGPPLCGVLFSACLVLSSHIPFISRSVPPTILESSAAPVLKDFLYYYPL